MLGCKIMNEAANNIQSFPHVSTMIIVVRINIADKDGKINMFAGEMEVNEAANSIQSFPHAHYSSCVPVTKPCSTQST